MLFEKTTYEDDFPISIRIMHVSEYPAHYHLDHEIVYVLNGSIRLKNGSSSYILEEGDVFTNSGNEVHGIYSDGINNTVAIIQLSNQFFSKYFPLLSKACFRTYVNDDKYQQLDTLRKMLIKILLNYTKRSFNYKRSCTEQMIDVIKYLKKHFNLFAFENNVVVNFKSDNPVIVKRISNIINYIYGNHSSKLTLETLSEREHLSTFYLSHLVRDYMGISFQELLFFARVEMSEIPLLDTDKRISTIAKDSGFSTTAYYNKYFVKWFGHTPQEHRELFASRILSPEYPARFDMLSENTAINLLRVRLSALKDQDNSDDSVRQMTYSVQLSANAEPIKELSTTLHAILTLEDFSVAGVYLLPYLYSLKAIDISVAIAPGDDETDFLLLQNRLTFLGYNVKKTYENNLPLASSYAYDSIAHAVSILHNYLISKQTELNFRLRDQGDTSVILKGKSSCLTSSLVPKPSYYAYQLIQKLQGDLLYWDPHCYIMKTKENENTWVLILLNYNDDVLNLCSRHASIYETRDIVRAFRDELQVDFHLSLPAGTYTIIQSALSDTNSIFDQMRALDFQEPLSLSKNWQQFFSTEPQTHFRKENVDGTLEISSDIFGVGVHITVIQQQQALDNVEKP